MEQKMLRTRRRDDQWERIEELLPGKPTDPGRTAADNRFFVPAVLWVLRCGAPWRDLPEAFGNWNIVYLRFARWQERGVCDRAFESLAREANFEDVFIDRSVSRVHQHSAGVNVNTT